MDAEGAGGRRCGGKIAVNHRTRRGGVTFKGAGCLFLKLEVGLVIIRKHLEPFFGFLLMIFAHNFLHKVCVFTKCHFNKNKFIKNEEVLLYIMFGGEARLIPALPRQHCFQLCHFVSSLGTHSSRCSRKHVTQHANIRKVEGTYDVTEDMSPAAVHQGVKCLVKDLTKMLYSNI